VVPVRAIRLGTSRLTLASSSARSPSGKREASTRLVGTSSQLLENDEAWRFGHIVDQLCAAPIPRRCSAAPDQPPGARQPTPAPFGGLPSRVDRFLRRPRVQDLWEESGRHQELMAARGRHPREYHDRQRRGPLNVRTLVVNIGRSWLRRGVDPVRRTPPDRDLESDELEAPDAVKRSLSWLVILIAFALYAGAVWLARGRRGMLRNVGAALFIVGILLLVIRRVVGNYIVDALSSGESVREAIGHSWIIGTACSPRSRGR
jgi:hypothetical protein